MQAYRDGQAVSLVTGAHGLITEWQTEESTRRVALTAGPVRLTQWCEEIIGASGQAITELERLATSHVARDPANGRMYFSPGSQSVLLLTDPESGRQYAAPLT